jgi:hypothetical protein
MIVLGVDPSLTSTGWCLVDDGVYQCSGRIKTVKTIAHGFKDSTDRINSIRSALVPIIKKFRPDTLVYEGPAYGCGFAVIHNTMCYMCDSLAKEYNMKSEIVMQENRIHFIRTKLQIPKEEPLSKEHVVGLCELLSGRVLQHDEADAFLLTMFSCE